VPNKGMKLTKPEHIGASQLILGVGRTSRRATERTRVLGVAGNQLPLPHVDGARGPALQVVEARVVGESGRLMSSLAALGREAGDRVSPASWRWRGSENGLALQRGTIRGRGVHYYCLAVTRRSPATRRFVARGSVWSAGGCRALWRRPCLAAALPCPEQGGRSMARLSERYDIRRNYEAVQQGDEADEA
jgi:hypothetical protein